MISPCSFPRNDPSLHDDDTFPRNRERNRDGIRHGIPTRRYKHATMMVDVGGPESGSPLLPRGWSVALAGRDPRGIHSGALGLAVARTRRGNDAAAAASRARARGNGGVSHEMRARGARRMKFTASVTREKGSAARCLCPYSRHPL